MYHDMASWRPVNGGYLTRSTESDESPAYTIVCVTKYLLEEGESIGLPEGWDNDVLAVIRWQTGRSDNGVVIGINQALGLAELGQMIISRYPRQLNYRQRLAVRHLVDTVSE